MAILASTINELVFSTTLSTITLSGTVKLDNVGVIRDLLIYKKGNYTSPYTVTSDSSGNWSVEVTGGSNDEFMIICIGIDDENSEIFDHIKG